MWFPLSWITGNHWPQLPSRGAGGGWAASGITELAVRRRSPVPRGAASWEGAGVGDAGRGVTAALGSAVGASLRPMRRENELLQPEAEAAGGRGAAGPGRAGLGRGLATRRASLGRRPEASEPRRNS